MSVTRADVIDAVTVRDGWAVLSIHHFEDWDEVEEPEEAMRRKLETYFDYVAGPRFQQRLHRVPARVELVSLDPVPEGVRELCASHGVEISEGV